MIWLQSCLLSSVLVEEAILTFFPLELQQFRTPLYCSNLTFSCFFYMNFPYFSEDFHKFFSLKKLWIILTFLTLTAAISPFSSPLSCTSSTTNWPTTIKRIFTYFSDFFQIFSHEFFINLKILLLTSSPFNFFRSPRVTYPPFCNAQNFVF